MSPYWKRIINGFQCKENKNWAFLITWLSTLLLVCESVIINNDGLSMIGLPREYHCALNYNNAFYVLGGQSSTNSLSMNFNNSTQTPPSIQWINNTSFFQQQQNTPTLCTVTSYGQAIIFNESSFQQSLILDLNTFNWNNITNIRRLSSFNIPSIIATTIIDDDQILLLSNNNNTITSWVLDASNEQLRWRISQLWSSSPSPPPPSINGGVQLITTSSYILYFHIDQQSSSSNLLYNVNVYGFDPSSMSWIGQLFNFTSATNYIHTSLINNSNNNNDNDTLLIVPTWIDKNLLSNSNENNNGLTEHGYWILNLSINTTDSTLSSSQINWHPLNDSISFLKGGSMTKLTDDTILFYGGLNNTNNLDDHSSFLFWNISNQSFLSTPSWLSALMPSPSPSPTALPTTNDNNNDNNKLIIILATLLGVFGAAFLIMIGIFFWYRKNKNKKSSSIIRETEDRNSPSQLRIEEGQDLINNTNQQEKEKNRSPRFSFIKKDNATIWSNQLQRALSKAFHQGNASSSNKNNENKILEISAPISINTTDNANINNKMISRAIMNKNRSSTSCPSLLTPSTSQNLSPNSARNSMHETASMTSRFVERI